MTEAAASSEEMTLAESPSDIVLLWPPGSAGDEPPPNRPAITVTVNCNGATRNINRKEADMSTKTIAEPEILLQPSDDGRRTKLKKRVVMAVLAITAFSGLALAVGANTTNTSPAPVPSRSAPGLEDVFDWCMPGVDCPPVMVPQVPGPDQSESSYSPAD